MLDFWQGAGTQACVSVAHLRLQPVSALALFMRSSKGFQSLGRIFTMLGASELQLPVDIPKSRCPDTVFVILCRLSAQACSLTSLAQGYRCPNCSLHDLSVTWSLVLEWVSGLSASALPCLLLSASAASWHCCRLGRLLGFPASLALPILATIFPFQVAQSTSVPVMCAGSRWLQPFHHRVPATALKRVMLMQQVVQILASLTSVARVSSGF